MSTVPDEGSPVPRVAGSRKAPLTVERVVEAAMSIAQERGYRAVNMRTVAARLHTGPSSLYAHVSGKDELDRHIAARLLLSLDIPEPDPERWQDQLVELYQQMAALFVRHPGIEHAYFASGPRDPAVLEVIGRATAIYQAGGLTIAEVETLESVLEAMAISHAIQTTVLHERLESLGTTYEKLSADWRDLLDQAQGTDELQRGDPAPHSGVLEARERLFAERLRVVIDACHG